MTRLKMCNAELALKDLIKAVERYRSFVLVVSENSVDPVKGLDKALEAAKKVLRQP